MVNSGHFLRAALLILAEIQCQAETYSELETLRDPTGAVVNAINRYAEDEERKLGELKRYATKLRRNITWSCNSSSATAYLKMDSLSFYILIRTLHKISELQQKEVRIEDYKLQLPTYPHNAGLALFRLQDTYALRTKDIANGNLSSDYAEMNSLKMTAHDCFELGKIAFELDPPDYYYSLLWFNEARDRLLVEKVPSLDEKELLAYLSLALYHQNNLERATLTAIRLKELDPTFPMINENLERYTNELKNRHVSLDNLDQQVPPLRTNRTHDFRFPDEDIYERLCRGELTSLEGLTTRRQLFCYWKSDNHFLKLAPFKAEMLHSDPEIIVFRKAISEMEADTIKRLAKSKLRRSAISTTTSLDLAKYRTSQTAWLADTADPTIAAISRRIQDISGLTTSTAENLQVAHYELGGHYMPHFDFAGEDRKHQFANLGTGDRMSTVLFYLSDTKAGGATVFPTLHLTVYPQEYDALMWHNLRRNGQGDRKTRHAACPVLLGVKWIANKWLHEYGQELRRPCGLEEND